MGLASTGYVVELHQQVCRRVGSVVASVCNVQKKTTVCLCFALYQPSIDATPAPRHLCTRASQHTQTVTTCRHVTPEASAEATSSCRRVSQVATSSSTHGTLHVDLPLQPLPKPLAPLVT